MITNIRLIENLKESYLRLKSDSCPNFIGKEKQIASEIVFNSEWDQLSDRRIDLIIVADNPGEKENKEKIYLSKNGNAGKLGRIFIEHFFELHRKKGQVLILNKTPFWSNKSSTLKETTGSVVKKSVGLTFEAIENFWKINKDVKIMIFGFDKGAIMNEYFFENYDLCKNENFKKAFYFGKHPSYGHLDGQLASALILELKTKRRIKSIRILSQINKLNREKIKDDYGIRI
jgi:hypothetical protein